MRLDQMESAFATTIFLTRHGPSLGTPFHDYPGIDEMAGTTPFSLKQMDRGLTATLKHASNAESQAANAGFSGVELFINAPKVNLEILIDFPNTGPLSLIPKQGIISIVNIKTADGWLRLPPVRHVP